MLSTGDNRRRGVTSYLRACTAGLKSLIPTAAALLLMVEESATLLK
jgi:hypothetical protein